MLPCHSFDNSLFSATKNTNQPTCTLLTIRLIRPTTLPTLPTTKEFILAPLTLCLPFPLFFRYFYTTTFWSDIICSASTQKKTKEKLDRTIQLLTIALPV